jgi:hypothetical protein
MPMSRLSSTVRAFVVQFHSDVSVSERRLAGRAEHLRTGEVIHFSSLEDLLGFVEHRIEADRAELWSDSTAEECQP